MKLCNTLYLILAIFFTTQISNAQNWSAKCITNGNNQNESNTWTDFVKEFEIDNVPPKAIASIACDSKYWMWINGELAVFEGQLKRGPTPNDTYFDEIDITPFLIKGKNKIAILTWYFGKDGFSHKNSGQNGLIFQCDAINLKTDNSWKSKLDRGFEYTSRPYPNYRLPESNIRFNAEKGSFDWVKPSADLNDFGSSKVIGDAESTAWNKLVKRPTPLFKDFGLKPYPEMPDMPFISNGDTFVCKLPYNAQITPYLKIESGAGRVIEILTDHYRGGGPQNMRGEYVTSEGIQEYESLGWLNGHNVFYCIPKGIKVLDLKYRETGFDTEFSGFFNCNDPFFNLMWQKSLRTLYVTMRDTYMDCPDRERAQWWGDMVNESGEAFYSLSPSAATLTEKGMLELVNWQKDNGVLYAPVPAGNWDRELPGQMLASIGYYGFWNYYQNTGDKKTIEQVYDGVKKYIDLWKIDDNGILEHREGEWYWGDWGINIDKQGLFNAWYYLALKGYKNMSELLGHNAEAEKTEKEMKAFKVAFNKILWTGSEYRSPGYEGEIDDRAQALAVVAGLADKDKFPTIYKLLQTQKYASPYMEKYVIEALFLMGYGEFGLQRLKERFYTMVNDPNISTLYEGWGTGKDGYGGGSANHAWSGGGLTILSQYVCGVYPIAPAWKTIQIKPQMAGLTRASTGNETVAGKYIVKVTNEKGEFSIEAQIPEGTNGVICIPDSYKTVTLNKKTIWKGKPISNSSATFLKDEDEYLFFEVDSGEWAFWAK